MKQPRVRHTSSSMPRTACKLRLTTLSSIQGCVLTEAQCQSTKSKARQERMTESVIDWKMPCARGTVIIVHANEHALAAHIERGGELYARAVQ